MVCFFPHICLLTLGISFFCSEGTSILEFTLFGSCIGLLSQNEGEFCFKGQIVESDYRI